MQYCAEQFTNDDSPVSTIIKSVKRTMAAEYSRELSCKVFAGQSRLITLGYKQGGFAGFGLRRMLIDEHGNKKGVLSVGEHKSIATDRVILVPGPVEEQEIVRWMYKSFIYDCKNETQIADELNKRGVKTDLGREWTRSTVKQVLTNEKYIGNNIFNRISYKLKMRRVKNPEDMWVRKDNAFENIVDPSDFFMVKGIFAARCRKLSDEEMLQKLKELQNKKGFLSALIIDEAEDMPSSAAYSGRFGGLVRAYKLIGFDPGHDYKYLEINKYLRNLHQDTIENTVQQLMECGADITSKEALKEALNNCWPINPVVVTLISQISRKRFGQNQRSIFSFLSSGELKAFRDFIQSTEYKDENLYMPEDLFDYMKMNLESSILSSSDSKIWNIATDILSRCQARGASREHLRVLKTIALIDLFNGASGLIASKDLLQTLYPSIKMSKILEDLTTWSVIILKKHLNSYSIYEGSDFDIEHALDEAYSAIPALEIQKLVDIASFKPIIAKRHYHKYGCMRWLDIILAPVNKYKDFLETEHARSKSVGFFSIFLPLSADEKVTAEKIIKTNQNFKFPVFLAIAKNNQIINEYPRFGIAKQILRLWTKLHKLRFKNITT